METPLSKHNDHSDKNCLSTCRLQYGISEMFEQILQEQQKVKASKSQTQPKLFSDPNDQKIYSHMLNDEMHTIFNSPDEHVIFRTALEGMNRNYPEILNGVEQNMFYAPTAFNFDSRIGETSSVPNILDHMQASLASKQILTTREKSNLKKIQAHLRKLRPQLAEQEFVDALACFFYQQRGIFIHSLKLDDHLKVLTAKAKLYRKQNKRIGFGFTDLENKLKEQFNISDRALIDKADIILEHLMGQKLINVGQKIKGREIRGAIDHQFKANDRMHTMRLFKDGQEYTLDEVKDGIKLGVFESKCHIAGENDLLIMFPDSLLILCVEIKRHMICKDKNSESKPVLKIDGHMTGASSQLKKNAKFFSNMHGDILSPGWQFAKVCAISPTLHNSEMICKNCKRFILTSEVLKTPEGLAKWWTETGLSDRSNMLDEKKKDEAYAEFQLFFYRLICLSSVHVAPDPFHTWSQIQGKNEHHMAAGHTRATFDEKKMGDLDVGVFLKSAHSAFKTLFFNKDQRALLATDKFPHAVFLCDFGAGKSLISKEKAIQTAEKQSLNPIPDPTFFISLVGVDSKGFVDEYEHIFDIYSKEYDFFGCDVKAISAQDLWMFYESKHKGVDREKTAVYTMAEFFVEQHSFGHFVVDECPFRTKKGTGYTYDATSVYQLKDFITNCRKNLKSDSNLFWVALQSNQLADTSSVEDDFKEALKDMKEDLIKNGWILPQLEANMRNQINISNINVKTESRFTQIQSSISKLKSGTNIVGELPILIKVKSSDWNQIRKKENWKHIDKKDQILQYSIYEMNKKDKKNVVVLYDSYFTFQDVGKDLKRLIKDKTVIEYPSNEGKKKDIANIKDFIEKDDHILVTHRKYFNGCEASNIIFLNSDSDGVRNSLLRGVKNVICIQVGIAKISGMKVDLRFY